MNEMVAIKSVKQYFNDYVYANQSDIQDPMKRAKIKMQILDSFRREIFGQITMKLGQDAMTISREKLADIGFVSNILTNAFRKWRRLCILCNDAGLVNWLQLDDLQKILDEEDAPDARIQGGDTDGDDISEGLGDENASEAV